MGRLLRECTRKRAGSVMNVCLDACFLIGLYDARDEHHQRSRQIFADLFDTDSPNIAVIVWPVMYESVSTRLVRHRGRTAALERDWRRLVSTNRMAFLDDAPYRDEAFELCLDELKKVPTAYRALSLTDRVLRSVLADRDADVDGIITANASDFADVCNASRRRIVWD
jgi:predicted nucleic acid-binding protein